MSVGRRRFIQTAAAVGFGAAGWSGTPAAAAAGAGATPASSKARGPLGLPADWRAQRKFDVHNHVFLSGRRGSADWTDVDNLIEAAGVLGIERLYCSRPITAGVMANIEAVREVNDTVIAAIRTLVAAGHVNLVETLAERVAAQCLAQQGVLWTKVRVEKLDIAPDAAAVGVEIFRKNA